MAEQEIAYEERYVCFIDILGFADAIKNPEHPIFSRGPSYFHHAIMQMKSVMDRPDLALTNPEVSQFSDSIAISCPVSISNLHMLLYKSSTLQGRLLQGALLSRGAITKGALYHDNYGCIFGPSLVQAVELEENSAKYPRVIIAPNVLADVDMNMSRSFINIDPDFSYVEYIEYWGVLNDASQVETIKEVVSQGLCHQVADVQTKYQWLVPKYNKLVDNLSSRFPALVKI